MFCNRCLGELGPGQLVEPAFSGRHPYAHADPRDCPPLREEERPLTLSPRARRLDEGGELTPQTD
jgi:hypothetical protein